MSNEIEILYNQMRNNQIEFEQIERKQKVKKI